MAKKFTTPGVFIEEKNAFPNSAVPVPTAVPAFIGYTEKALRNGKSLKNSPTRLSSFGEFLLYFGGAPHITFNIAACADSTYKLSQPAGRFLLYYSMKFFFANGGSDCYVVSVGDFNGGVKKSDFDGEAPVLDARGKPTGEVTALGIRSLLKEPEPTMLVIPDAVLLDKKECAEIQQAMLDHCKMMRGRFAILDVPMPFENIQNPATEQLVTVFRENIRTDALQWGAAYYPYLHTTITGMDELSFQNIHPAKNAELVGLLRAAADEAKNNGQINASQAASLAAELDKIPANNPATDAAAANMLHQGLLQVSPLYRAILESMRQAINILPPSGAMAGIYSTIDNTIGVFQAPANVGMASVTGPVINLTNAEQENLNVPLDGKSVNAIRTFPGKGVLVWGARTMDGNSQDWRYISVRRTAIFIEQSIKYAIEPYVFAPNTAATWTNVKALIANFLMNIWKSGALAGATPGEAFSVDVGLGITMTPVDILDGIMRVSVKIAVTRPAEFIVLSFEQKMEQS
ncbi:MAG: phage tail sheath family protein [Lewinellaceae bacterium]|nr:phage tail sheath family protein [Lewinellaceae bacterium]